MTDLETILSWFQTGDMPTEEEFRQTFSSFRHKNTKIPIEKVDRLESLLNSKINSDDYIKDGKIRADKIEALGLTELIEASEKDISEFAENSDKYEFQQNDFIAIPNEEGNFSLYLFKGGEKRNKSNYLSTGVSNGGEPLFLASPAYNITQANINNWNAPETDPVFTASPAHSITQADIDLWNQEGSGGGFIPLSGTEPGKPSTNPIEFTNQNTEVAMYSGDLQNGPYKAIKFSWDDELTLENSFYGRSNKITAHPLMVRLESSNESNSSLLDISAEGVGLSSSINYYNTYSKQATISVGNGVNSFLYEAIGNDIFIYKNEIGKDDGREMKQNISFNDLHYNAFTETKLQYNSVNRSVDYKLYFKRGDVNGYSDAEMIFAYDRVVMPNFLNAQDDPTFTRQIVQKEDGTLGYIKNGFESGQLDSFGQFPGDSIGGICTYEYQKGSKYVTVRLKIYIYLGTEDGNPHEVWINVPFGLGYTQQRIFDAFTGNSVIMTTQLNQISFMKTTREFMGVNIAACYTFPYGAEAGDD